MLAPEKPTMKVEVKEYPGYYLVTITDKFDLLRDIQSFANYQDVLTFLKTIH